MKESEIPIRHSCPKKYGISKIRTIGIDETCNICNYRYGYNEIKENNMCE